jgi:hypothetical protein
MNAIKFSDIINRIRSEIITQVSEGHFEDEMSYSRFERYSRDLPLFKLNSKYRNKPEYFSVLHTPNESKNYEMLILKPREKRNKNTFFVIDDWNDVKFSNIARQIKEKITASAVDGLNTFKVFYPEQDACFLLYQSNSIPPKPSYSFHTFLRAL